MAEWTVYWRCEGFVDGIEGDSREAALEEARRCYETASIGELAVEGDRDPVEFYWADPAERAATE